jgi:SAM-dependent methyltransferase
MTSAAATLCDLLDPTGGKSGGDGQKILAVSGEGQDRFDGLTVPFADATVVACLTGETDLIRDEFDTVVVGRDTVDWQSLNETAALAARVLRPGGRLVLMLPLADTATSEPSNQAGLNWHGLSVLNGRPCAVLGLAGTTGGHQDTMALLATADAACRLTLAHAGWEAAGLTTDEFRAMVAREVEDRRRSEQALLGRIDRLVAELDERRRRHRMLTLAAEVLRGGRAGPTFLNCLCWAQRLLDRLRRRASTPRR